MIIMIIIIIIIIAVVVIIVIVITITSCQVAGMDAARTGASQSLQPELLFGVPLVLAGGALPAGQPAPHVCSGT